jgi:hypothetical protein
MFYHFRSFFIHFSRGLAFIGIRSTKGRFWKEEETKEYVDAVEDCTELEEPCPGVKSAFVGANSLS